MTFDFTSGLNDSISRLSSLSDSTGTLESYSYLGLGTVVIRSHPQPALDLTYVKQSGESNGAAGDQYTGLDAFGRVIDQRWINTSTSTAVDRYTYTHNRDGNVLSRSNLINSSFDEAYTYDGLNQLTGFTQGSTHSQPALSRTIARLTQILAFNSLAAAMPWEPPRDATDGVPLASRSCWRPKNLVQFAMDEEVPERVPSC